jgi:RNA polymerase sigma-70 factor (ECF subfamily)
MSAFNLPGLFGVSDEQLMWRVRTQDDAEAFAELVGKWQGPIQRICVRMTGDSHRGEDLAQEAFSRLFGHRKEYQPAARFSTYLWRVSMNLCYDELRRMKRRPEMPLEFSTADGEETLSVLDTQAASEAQPDAALQMSEQAEMVREALQRLPEHYRAVLILRHYENLKFREIADVLDVPEGTVKSRMAEGLDLLQQFLTRALRAEMNPLPRPAPRSRESLVL